MSKNWGYILSGPGRPERTAQRKVMQYAGCDLGEYGTVWEDRLPERATRPQTQLRERNLLVNAVRTGDVVHVASLLCLGVSGPDVRRVLGEMRERGATVVIHEGARELAPGDDPEAVIADYDRARNALHRRRSRQKQRKSK